jgi:hypothetical protein
MKKVKVNVDIIKPNPAWKTEKTVLSLPNVDFGDYEIIAPVLRRYGIKIKYGTVSLDSGNRIDYDGDANVLTSPVAPPNRELRENEVPRRRLP